MNFFYFLKNLNKKLSFLKFHFLFIPIFIIFFLSMLILPLPSYILDLFFTFNIVLSVMILIVTLFIKNTLEFSSFPIMLLFTTLFRLALNIASTRVILLKGYLGPYSAGYVIHAFGHFLVGGNIFIGIIVFIILVIINFIVITKGSERIAEVSARFFLDSIPGRQMSVDSDLNSGIIDLHEAKKRRKKIEQESEFYGSMDGASKFISGDAISGILIMIVNIIGGFIIGVGQFQMTFLKAAQVYSLLTIGDGLIAQIPALIISTASGIMVTRTNSDNRNVGEQIFYQVFLNTNTMFLSGIVLGVFGLIPGMPNFIFLFFSFVLVLFSFFLFNDKSNFLYFLKNSNKFKKFCLEKNKTSWNDVYFENPITLELSINLVDFLNNKNNSIILNFIEEMRKKITVKVGFLVPSIVIKKNINLKDNYYKILIKGIEIFKGFVFLDKILAVNFNNSNKILSKHCINDPIFQKNSFWIDIEKKKEAKKEGFKIFTIYSIIVTHLRYVIIDNLYELFGLQETQKLIDIFSMKMPKLMENFVPEYISLISFQKILKNLIKEKIFITDMTTIFSVLIEHSPNFKNDVDKLTEIVRVSLGKLITQKFFSKKQNIEVIGLSNDLELILIDMMKKNNSTIDPKLFEILFNQFNKIIIDYKKKGQPIILLVNHSLRIFLSQNFIRIFPELVVLSYFEIVSQKKIKIINYINK